MGILDRLVGRTSPLVRDALGRMKTMLDVSESMFAAATGRLLDNEPLSDDLQQMDERVNALEREIRRNVLEHVTMAPDRDVTVALTLTSIVQDAERIGDLAKSLAEVADLADSPRMGEDVATLRKLRDRIAAQFALTREALVSDTGASARRVMDETAEIKAALWNVQVALAAREDLRPNSVVVLASAARMLSRVSSHLSNLASSVALPFDRIRGDDEGSAARG